MVAKDEIKSEQEIKSEEEVKEEVKEHDAEDDGAFLDDLERESKEFNKVHLTV